MATETLTLNGIEYVRKDSTQPNGNRAVVVVDRGWVFAGDVTEENGRIKLTRAVWVKKWSEIWLDGVIDNPKTDKATISPLKNPVDIPADAEVFRIPVADDWGL